MVYVIRISTTKTFQSFLKFSKYYICNQESPSFLEHAYLWMQICTNAFSYYEFLNASLHIIIEVWLLCKHLISFTIFIGSISL